MTSPAPGRSTLITCAPMSASRQVANGPDNTCSKASILTPSRARGILESLVTLTSCLCVNVLNDMNRLLIFGSNFRKQVRLWRKRFLPHHHAARVIDDNLAFLLDAARPYFNDAPLGF